MAESNAHSASEISPVDRQRLSSLLEQACAECFPNTEHIGNSPLRDRLFRALLVRLLENARHSGVAAVAGSYDALYSFACKEQNDASLNGRRRYQRKSMPALVSHWKQSLKLARTYTASAGRVQFHLRTSREASGDFALIASVSGSLSDSGSFCAMDTVGVVPDAAWLHIDSATVDATESEQKRRLVQNQVERVFGRSPAFANDYRDKLAALTLSDVRGHIEQFNQRLAKRDARGALLLVTFVILGWLTYSIIERNNFEPVYRSSAIHRPTLKNVTENENHQIAIVDNRGFRVSPWTNRIRNPQSGAYVGVVPIGGGRFDRFVRGPIRVDFDIPPAWFAASSAALPTEVAWDFVPCNPRGVLFWVLIDTRYFFPESEMFPPPISLAVYPSSQETSSATPRVEIWPREGTAVAGDRHRFLLSWEHIFDSPGDYDVDLLYSPDLRERNGAWVRDTLGGFRIARFHVPAQGPARERPNTEAPAATRHLACADHGRMPPQMSVAYSTATSKPVGLVIVPNGSDWSSLSELQHTQYAVLLDDTTWVGRDQISTEQTRTGQYAFRVLLGELEGMHSAQLFVAHAGKQLPATPRVSMQVTGERVTFSGPGVSVTPCGTATWDADPASQLTGLSSFSSAGT